MQQMREAGLSEQDIFGAISRNPEALARFKAEDEAERVDKLMSRQLPGGTENLPNQARKMRDNMRGWNTIGDSAKAGLEGAANVLGRAANTATAGAFNAGMELWQPGSTRGQEELHPLVMGTADAATAFEGPVARMLGPIGNRVSGAITSRLPTTSGAVPGVTRFFGNVGAGAAAGGVTGGVAATANEAGRGFPRGSALRIAGGTGLGAAMGAGGQVLSQAGEGLQRTRGVRAASLARAGEEEARRIVAKGVPDGSTEGLKRFADAEDIVKFPQGGKAARFGMDVSNEAEFAVPKAEAYAAADATAKNKLVDVTELVNELRGVRPNGSIALRSPDVDRLGNRMADIIEGHGGHHGARVFMPADRLNEFKTNVIGDKEAFRNVPGVAPSQFARADAITRKLNAEHYGAADRVKADQEIARERMRVSMGLQDEPGIAREAADINKLQSYLQPSLHGHRLGWNVSSNLQALSAAPPVQGSARLASSFGSAVAAAAPRAAPLAVQTLQQWIAAADEQRKASMIGTIFSKQKESQNGVRQQDSAAPGP
jgi:hypothetical protein